MTQAEIQHRISLVSSTDVAVGRISQQSISLVCTHYRQKKIEKEQLFTRRDMMMMTGIRNQIAVTRFLKRSKIGTKFASHTLYTQSDVDRILEAFSPPLDKVSSSEIERSFSARPGQARCWARTLGIRAEKKFGTLYFSNEEVSLIRERLELARLNLTIKRLALRSGASYYQALTLVRRRGWGKTGLSSSCAGSLFLAQGEYGEAMAVLRSALPSSAAAPAAVPSA